MSANDLSEVAQILNLICIIPAVLFPVVYSIRSAWYKSNIGRSLLGVSSILAVLFVLTYVRTKWPELGSPRDWLIVSIAFYGYAAITLWYFTVSMLTIEYRRK